MQAHNSKKPARTHTHTRCAATPAILPSVRICPRISESQAAKPVEFGTSMSARSLRTGTNHSRPPARRPAAQSRPASGANQDAHGQPTGTKAVQPPRPTALPTPCPGAFCAPRQVEQVVRAVGRASPARHSATALLERLDVVILPRHTAPLCMPTAPSRPAARPRPGNSSHGALGSHL